MTDKELDDIAAFLFAALAALLFGVFFLAACCCATMIAWRMVMPEVFGLPELSLKNAVGLVGLGVVARFLVSSRGSEK